MRFSGSLILGLLAANGLAQTAVPEQGQQSGSEISQPEPSAPAAEEPSPPVQDQPSIPADDDTPQTDAGEAPIATATAVPEPTADDPVETADASQISDDNQPSATATGGDDDDEATTAAEGTATADGKEVIDITEASHSLTMFEATATNDDATATTAEMESGDNASDTATATATSSSAPTSTAPVVEVNLKNATVGENAELVTVDSKPAIKLSAPANGQATFSVPLETDSDGFDSDDLIYIVASIRVGEPSGSAKFRTRDTDTDCSLQIQAGGQTVYDQPLSTNNGEFQDVTSSGISSSDMGKSSVAVTQKCGQKPSPLTIRDVRAGTESAVKSSDGSGGSSSGGSSRSGGSGNSDGTSTTGAGARETGGSGNFGSKAQASVGALAAAVLAAAVLF
ncbi:hypothetical protein FHETE_7790 [Fusarium heterosporum]|uniref:Cell wall protein n=1 Tax=Fusarium heterosporum TaxID=42747 RepID=A0A8H5T518_FUSHE|nr:hypothetical protein FHETE_7790 [Fusarium heterosporum]